jgi:hypothetical protein
MEAEMTSVIVQLFLHGLIALVPLTGADGKANQMVALAVDARQEQLDKLKLPSDLSCVKHHDPMLRMPIRDGAQGECDAVAGCTSFTPDQGTPRCECQPVRKKIWFEPSISPQPQVLPTAVPPKDKELPASHNPDFSYVHNLGTAGRKLDPAFITGAPSLLLDRMTFPFDSVTACKLAARDQDKDSYNIHSFSFRRLKDPHDPAQHTSQGTAQALLVSTQYQVSAQQPLKLHLTNLDGSDDRAITLPQSGVVAITFMNSRQATELDDPCDDGVGRDFALFYLLSTEPPTSPADWLSDKVRLPHVKFTVWAKSSDVETLECDKVKKLIMSHPVCALAAYNAPAN